MLAHANYLVKKKLALANLKFVGDYDTLWAIQKNRGGRAVVLQESGEMYLETILILSSDNVFVRAIDVGEYMGFSKPSVSRAMSNLRQDGYVEIAANGAITLTERGQEIAEKIYERHTLLTEFLVKLGVREETAEQDACKIEHDISDESFEAMKRHTLHKDAK